MNWLLRLRLRPSDRCLRNLMIEHECRTTAPISATWAPIAEVVDGRGECALPYFISGDGEPLEFLQFETREIAED